MRGYNSFFFKICNWWWNKKDGGKVIDECSFGSFGLVSLVYCFRCGVILLEGVYFLVIDIYWLFIVCNVFGLLSIWCGKKWDKVFVFVWKGKYGGGVIRE